MWNLRIKCARETVPSLFGTGDWFCGRQFLMGGGVVRGGLGVVQAYYIQCVLYFYYHHTVIYYTTQHSAESVRTPSLSSCNWTLPSGAMGNGYKYRWSFLTDHELVLVRDLGVEDPGARIWLNLTNTSIILSLLLLLLSILYNDLYIYIYKTFRKYL